MTEQALGCKSITIAGDSVIKLQPAAAARVEYFRTEAARRVARETGLFRVPEVLSYDECQGKIVFERLDGLTSFRLALRDPEEATRVVQRTARALGAIHALLEVPGNAPQLAPDAMKTGAMRENRPWHGDFGVVNLFWEREREELVILDWANAPWLPVDVCLGPPEFDVSMLLTGLFFRRVFGPFSIAHREQVAYTFLREYRDHAPAGLSLEALRGAVVSTSEPRWIALKTRLAGRLRMLAHRPSVFQLRRFLRRIARQGL